MIKVSETSWPLIPASKNLHCAALAARVPRSGAPRKTMPVVARRTLSNSLSKLPALSSAWGSECQIILKGDWSEYTMVVC